MKRREGSMHSRIISYMICILMLTTFFPMEVVKNVNVQVIEEWEAGNENQENSDDLVNSLSVDSNENIYMTVVKEGSTTNDLKEVFPNNKGDPSVSMSGAGGLADSPWPMYR
ncbi:MAG: hypothetical protein JSV09_05790 [Thermoplasmata archaeon]|nr:MAG: hypothetical protein JSV09_05790 [Thermoplasmata archaeon]